MKCSAKMESGKKFGPVVSFIVPGKSAHSGNPETNGPPANLYESDLFYKLELIIPGFERENITICITSDIVIEISAECKEEASLTNMTLNTREYLSGTFCRSFLIPMNAQADETEARYENGILTLKIPKNVHSSQRNSYRIMVH